MALLAACNSELSTLRPSVVAEPPATTTTEAATTTSTLPPPVYPLTGLPVTDGNELAVLRPVVVAKVGNYDAHPQSGAEAGLPPTLQPAARPKAQGRRGGASGHIGL